MRDLVVREALQTMARDAAKRFRELVRCGSELPYDVREADNGSPLPQYTPLTERFVRENAPLLRELDSFGSACAAVEASDLAAPYLAQLGQEVPPDGRRCAETAVVIFLCRLWHDSTDFSLDDERLGLAIAELQINGDATEGEIEVVVPLRGLRMETLRVDLATASIVRADSVDVPAEARSAEASSGAGWEPTYLAVTRVSRDAASAADSDDAAGPDAGTRAVEAFRSLVTTLRLFKAGGVALGPHAWTRLGGGRWRRISTGAGRPRPGGYRLAASELAELAVFSRAMAHRIAPPAMPDRGFGATPLGRSVSRFEAGLERTAALDALNDYLLSLRFLLEGGGPADLGLSMRVASLCADPDGRGEVKAAIDRALGLERELWSGEPPRGLGEMTPADTAVVVEDLARAILKDAACGHLGSDLRATADEILLADGLAVGEGGERGETAEWGSAGEVEIAVDGDEIEREDEIVEHDEEVEEVAEGPRHGGREQPVAGQSELWFDGLDDDDTNDVQVIRQPDRISVHRNQDREEESVYASSESQPAQPEDTDQSPVLKLLELHSAEREATAARVANLFPRPETTEWSVREISYDRTRRAHLVDSS
ncbi:MAG: hypothetical protein ABI726_09240 [bacterium]